MNRTSIRSASIQNELYSGSDPLSACAGDGGQDLICQEMEQRILADAEPIPGYRLIERLGRGGYGEVWKAEAPGGIHKAIKFVAGDVDGFGDDGKAAEQEFKSLNRVKTIRHPFLLSIERFEVIDSQLVIVMELADRNLWDRFSECQKHGLPGIPRSELLRYMDEAAEALDLMNLHHQIQHLDVKPQNIFLVHQHVKVADFGLAKDLEGAKTDLTGGITPTYAPPETFEGWVSRQSDQYSLAIVFMEMLTGRRPFNGTNTRQLVMQHLTAVPDLAPLSPNDRGPIGRALSKKPEDRFSTCAELVLALRGDGPAVPAAPRNLIEPEAQRAKSTADTDVPGGPTQLAPRTERRSFPALVTPSSRNSVSASNSQLRRESNVTPRADVAPVERVGEGVLVPALLVSAGGIGLEFLRELRGLIASQFGKPTLPHLRWMHLDTDAVSAERSDQNDFSPQDVVLTRLRRPAHYLSADKQAVVDSWLPREDLFQISRQLSTAGIRSLGRLAFCDHYHVISHRIRAALETFLSVNPIEEAERATRLGLRSTFPHVYIAASSTGGTGSGMLLDLAYLIRREIQRLGFGKPHVVGLLGVPFYGSETVDSIGWRNARSTLAELHHFSTSKEGYRAQFDARASDVTDSSPPFRRVLLAPIGCRPSASHVKQAAEVVAHLAFAELLTPIGRTALREPSAVPHLQVTLAGVRRLAWPRADVLRVAGWELARKTLASWSAKPGNEPATATVAAIDNLWTDREFKNTAIRELLEALLSKKIGMSLTEFIAAPLTEFALPLDGGGCELQRARTALTRLIELIGRPGTQESEHPHEVGRLLSRAVQELAAHGDARLGGAVNSLLEQPGLRMAGAEDAARLLQARIQDELVRTEREAARLEEQSLLEFVPLCQQLFASNDPASKGSRAEVRLGPQLQQWATTRLRSINARACASVFRVWLGNLPEYLREIAGLRNQFLRLAAQLEAASPPIANSTGVCRAIFPEGVTSVEGAAKGILASLTPADLRAFENDLQARIRHQLRRLTAISARPQEAGPAFLNLLNEQAVLFLDTHIPRLTASQVLSKVASRPDALRDQVSELVATSTPVAVGPERSVPASLIVCAVPSDEMAGRVADLVRNMSPSNAFHVARCKEDVILYQETSAVDLAALPHLTAGPTPAPPGAELQRPTCHARSDIKWGVVGLK
jgi:eukaryotic-like serine/threonine-protein kinase